MADQTELVQQLFAALSMTHPEYDKYERMWTLFRDVLGDSEPDMKEYLPKGEFESADVYDMRLQLSEWVPESENPILKLTGAIFSRQPVRDLKPHVSELETFVEDCDLRGNPWADRAEDIGRDLLGYGTIRILINQELPDELLEQIDKGERPTRAQEKEAGVRPHVISYNPLAVPNWAHDRFGNLLKVVIREETTQPKSDGAPGFDEVTRFIEIDRQESRWWEFIEVEDGGKYELVGSGSAFHGLGVVPMIVDNFPKSVSPMVGSGFIRKIAKADLRKVRAESDLHFDLYVHAHPQMVYKGETSPGKIGIGSSKYIHLKPEGEELMYLTLPESTANQQRMLVDMNIEAMHRHAGTDPLGQQTNPGSTIFQTTGVSRAWSFGTTEGRILKKIAAKLERIERRVMDLVIRWQAEAEKVFKRGEKIFTGVINYPDDFDPSAPVTLFDYAERLNTLDISDTLKEIVFKRLAVSISGEISVEQLQSVFTEIEKAAHEADAEERVRRILDEQMALDETGEDGNVPPGDRPTPEEQRPVTSRTRGRRKPQKQRVRRREPQRTATASS